MDDIRRQLPAEPGPADNVLSLTVTPIDELETARKRMRHLAPWHIAPVPLRGAGGAARRAASRGASEERCRHLALQVLAVQMAQARPRSALT